jgi:hypothetical protein
MIKPSTTLAILSAALVQVSPVCAGTYGDDLTRCILQSSTDEDKATVLKWTFSNFGQNPALGDLPRPSQAQADELARKVVENLERLAMVNCRKEAIAALKFESPSAIAASFGTLAETIGQTLYKNPSVAAGIVGVIRFMDRSKWQDLFAEAGVPSQPAPPAVRQ